MSLLHSRCKLTSVEMKSFHASPPHSVFNHLCVSGSLWALILMPHSLTLQTLRCPSVSAESNLPPSTSSLIWRSSLLKHSRPDPAPTSPKPLSLVRLAKRVPPCVAAACLLSSISSQHKAQAALCTLSCRPSGGCNLHQRCPHSLELVLQTQTLTSPLNSSSAKRNPPSEC